MEPYIKAAMESMRKHGFDVVELETAAQAKDYLVSHIPAEASIGVSGSVTIRETEVIPALQQKGCTIYQHWGAKKEDVPDVLEHARMADVYLASANAVTKGGSLVFIDGTCNRVSTILYGPKQVYFVVSFAKFVDGGINTAVARIKQTACPQNARRIGLSTPCATTGICKSSECDQECMCNATVTLDRVPRGRSMSVLLVAEALGY